MQELLPLPTVPGIGLQDTQRAAVLPSIGSALDWLRKCVRERPNLRVQVCSRTSCPCLAITVQPLLTNGCNPECCILMP